MPLPQWQSKGGRKQSMTLLKSLLGHLLLARKGLTSLESYFEEPFTSLLLNVGSRNGSGPGPSPRPACSNLFRLARATCRRNSWLKSSPSSLCDDAVTLLITSGTLREETHCLMHASCSHVFCTKRKIIIGRRLQSAQVKRANLHCLFFPLCASNSFTRWVK